MTFKHTHTLSAHPTGELLPARETGGCFRGGAPHSIKPGRSPLAGGALVKIDSPTRSTFFALGRKNNSPSLPWLDFSQTTLQAPPKGFSHTFGGVGVNKE